MKPLHVNTALIESPELSKRAGVQVWLKLENTQPTGSFKIRGIGHLCQHAKAGKLITLDSIDSIAKSLGAKTVSGRTLDWDKRHEIRSVVLSDKQAVSACIYFANDQRSLVEPACGASLAVAYDQYKFLQDMRSVVIIVCGGIGVDMDKLRMWDRNL